MGKPLDRDTLRRLGEKFYHLARYTGEGNTIWENCLRDAIQEITQFGAERFGNAHDDLLAACEDLLGVLSEPGIMDVDQWNAWKRVAEEAARAAIAKATPKPPRNP